jgi:phosphatidylinositol alpha-1,6-mannosyltransferase
VGDALLVTSSFLPGSGGIESHLARLCAALAPRVAVFAPARRDGKPLPRNLGYDVVGYDGSLLIPTRAVLEAIRDAATRFETRRILFGTPWPLALLGPELAGGGLSYSIVVHGAETFAPGTVPLLRARLVRALAGADLLLPVSAFTANQLRKLLANRGGGSPPVHLLRPGVDVTRFTPRARDDALRRALGVGTEQAIVLHLGRLVRRKGVHRLIRAYPALAERARGVVVVVAGTGPQERRLHRLAERTGGRIEFLGHVDEDEAPALYASADVFAFPVADRWAGLDTEGLGVVLLEAAASGLPSVTGRSGGTPEAVLDGATGFVVDATDQDRFVHAIASVLRDRQLARRMGVAARRHVEHTFTGEPPAALLDWLHS